MSASIITNFYGLTGISKLEKDFESREFVDNLIKWTGDHWHWTIYTSIVYVLAIFGIQYYMKERKRYELRTQLATWNILLAVFSIVGTLKTLPFALNNLLTNGVDFTLCNDEYLYSKVGCWTYIFAASKFAELIDTLFIVLRKQKLIFLHWYHHSSVLVFCFYSAHYFSASIIWFAAINYFIHSIMYSYYACKALKIPVPASISQLITISQLTQMFIGCYLNYKSYTLLQSGISYKSCRISSENLISASLLYLSFAILFFNFFIKTYYSSSKKSKQAVKAE